MDAMLEYTHVDVFSAEPFSGNSVPVFLSAQGLSAEQMLRITALRVYRSLPADRDTNVRAIL